MGIMKNLLEYLEKTADLFPDKTAFADEVSDVTFSGLLKDSRSLGSAISELTGEVNRPVAVLADRSVACITAFMGVLQSGNFYVPIDINMPAKRIESILNNLEPLLLICEECDQAKITELDITCSVLTVEQGVIHEIDYDLIISRRMKVLDIDPAYVIYTSGSTGTPKGIVVSHRSVIDFTEWMTTTCGFSSTDVMGNQAPFHFDMSVKDIYQTLKCGATTHIVPKKLFMFPKLLMDFISSKGINTLSWATSAFTLIANSGILSKTAPHNLKKVVLGGEALHAKHLNIWRAALPHVRYINLYGPTEVTVDCTYYIIDREFSDDEDIPIGRSCENMEVMLLDNDLVPVPKGETGEICVRGIGLAKGYYGDFTKTSEAFVQNPLNRHYPDLIYRTGDLGRLNEEGLIIYLTRKDGQIKHMGYRIELGELEKALNSLPEIKNAVCLFDDKRDKIICVYQGDISTEGIISHLRTMLPKYMFPNIFEQVPEMPYNSNGKIDRVGLRERYIDGTNKRV